MKEAMEGNNCIHGALHCFWREGGVLFAAHIRLRFSNLFFYHAIRQGVEAV